MRFILYVALMAFLVGIQVPALAGFIMPDGVSKKPVISASLPEAPLPSRPQESTNIVPSIPAEAVSLTMASNVVDQRLASAPLSAPIEARRASANYAYQSVMISKPIIEPARPSMMIRNDYIKSDAETKILSQPVRIINANGVYGAPVPEPGSLAGLSAGLFGLLFQVRRIRKRS